MKLNRILYLLILCLFFNGNFSISLAQAKQSRSFELKNNVFGWIIVLFRLFPVKFILRVSR